MSGTGQAGRGVTLNAVLPLEKDAESRIVEVAWGGETRPLTRDEARTLVRVATSGTLLEGGRSLPAGTVNQMKQHDRLLAALAHRDLDEADLMVLLTGNEVRSVAFTRALATHPSCTHAVLARLATTAWRAGAHGGDTAALTYLESVHGAIGRAVRLYLGKSDQYGEAACEALILEAANLGEDGIEIYETLLGDAPQQPGTRSVPGHQVQKHAELLDQARMLTQKKRDEAVEETTQQR